LYVVGRENKMDEEEKRLDRNERARQRYHQKQKQLDRKIVATLAQAAYFEKLRDKPFGNGRPE
jgi:hypothetical protein